MSIRSINPTTGELLKTFEPLSLEDTMQSVEAAHKAFGQWRKTPFAERKKLMLNVAASLRENQSEYAKLITLEMGKRFEEAMGEIEYCAHICDFYANGAEDFLADQKMAIDDGEAYIQHAPKGPLLGVMPWNFPFYQVIRFAAPNIMAGNTCLIKHAGTVPQCAKALHDLFDESGFPNGVFTHLLIPSEFVATVIESEYIVGVSLTGSEAAGASVAEIAGKNIKPSVLELGGNDAFIVLDDADLDHVVQMAIKGRMVNNGQSCVASKRFIVVESLAQEFLAAFKEHLQSMNLGDPLNKDTDLGPLSSEEAAVRLAEQVQKTVDAGATVVIGGDRPSRGVLKNGAFYNPTILTDVTPEMPSFDEELFGPVATVYVVKDETQAIQLANHSSFGLGGSVFTKDIDLGRRVAEQMDTGMVFINQPTQSQAELPFGGTKNSGYGRELSHLGIMEFINKKLIHLGKTSN